MTRKFRVVSGEEISRFLTINGFTSISARGSHAKFQRKSRDGMHETLHLPLHKEISKGTARAILKQAEQYISSEILLEFFMTKE